MLFRLGALVAFVAAVCAARAQQALPQSEQWLKPSQSAQAAPESAWLDLRQVEGAHSNPQAAPAWVEAISFTPPNDQSDQVQKSVFRIRLTRPNDDCQILLVRLFFDDDPQKQPQLVAWDESGTQVLKSGSLGQGTNLATSATTLVPMIGVSSIDIEVPGDGRTIRGAYLDWMKTSQVVHPVNAAQREMIPEPFAAAAPLKNTQDDAELFGTVTAPLATEVISIGPSVENGAGFEFEIESQPLIALLTFEVESPQIEAPPEVFVNGTNLGAVSLSLPDLADPAYRGLSRALLDEMQFQYTGWIRAQKLVPASALKGGTNSVIVVAGAGTTASAIRETQIQLKYLWDKSDYLLEPLK